MRFTIQLTMIARSPLAPVLRSIAKCAIAFNAPGVITKFTYTTTTQHIMSHLHAKQTDRSFLLFGFYLLSPFAPCHTVSNSHKWLQIVCQTVTLL